MYAIEFQATVKDGTIEVPEQFRDKLTERVKVIILADVHDKTNNIIDQLLKSPLKVKGFQPLSRDDSHVRG